MRALPVSLKRLVATTLSRVVIRDYSEFCPRAAGKRALLSFVTAPLLVPKPFRERQRFSNRGAAQAIPRILNELGYAVDIVNCTNRSWRPDRDYDLFVGHAGWNFVAIADALRKPCPMIYYSTGVHWREHNRRADLRHLNLSRRTGRHVPAVREVRFEEDSAYERANGIICLGNGDARRTFQQYEHVFPINNATFPSSWEGWRRKDYDAGRRHFLFFSGHGNVHKGLDILIEAFRQTDCHLHVCQSMERSFLSCYGKVIRGEPGIHLYGFIKCRSRLFYELAMTCNWIITATCAEGQPGAILDGMAAGLIPITPREANLDIGPGGILLPSNDVDAVVSTIRAASSLTPAECRQKAEAVLKEIVECYSVERFRESFKAAIRDILVKY
jgi:glycosyltransferase involved in cell wall biosynthesis